MNREILAVVLAYALGCLQTGYYLVLLSKGLDLRHMGSGSTGARNVGRVLGRKGFLFTLIMDAGKGALAIASAIWLDASPLTMAIVLVAVTVGHVWPIQLRFSGGRGVAVGLGALAVFDFRLLLVLFAVTLLARALGSRFQQAGLAGFAAIPIAAWLFRVPVESLVGIGCLSLLVIIAHRSHIACCLMADGKMRNKHKG